MTTDKDLAVAREMLDAEIAAMTKTLAERDALCEAQTRTIHGIPALMRERDAAIAAKEVAEENWDKLTEVADGYYKAQLAAESREHALGVQVDALQKRLALFEEGAALLRDVVDDCEGTTAHYYRVQRAMIDINVGCFLAKVDAVPGDALATCKPGLQVGVEASGVDVERVSAPAYAGEDEVTP